MELLDGLDADRLVRRFGPVPAERAIYLLRRSAIRWPRRSRAAWCIATSSRPTSSSAATGGPDFVKVLDSAWSRPSTTTADAGAIP